LLLRLSRIPANFAKFLRPFDQRSLPSRVFLYRHRFVTHAFDCSAGHFRGFESFPLSVGRLESWRAPSRRGGGWPPGALAYLSVSMLMRLPSAQAQHKAAAQQVYLTRWTVGPVLAFSCQVLTASRRPETPDGKLQKHYFILAIDSTTLWLITILLTTKELGPIAFEVDQRANRCASRRLTRRVHDAKVWQQTPKHRQPAISA
jgi:hypothetical protein